MSEWNEFLYQERSHINNELAHAKMKLAYHQQYVKRYERIIKWIEEE